jgi:hypothetical protein
MNLVDNPLTPQAGGDLGDLIAISAYLGSIAP